MPVEPHFPPSQQQLHTVDNMTDTENESLHSIVSDLKCISGGK